MTTEEIIKELRTYQMSAMSKAADRLEELERDIVRLRRVTTRPEPSRLEIAAMIMAQWEGAKADKIYTTEWNALSLADSLIRAAKEAK